VCETLGDGGSVAAPEAAVPLDIRIDREICMGSGNCSYWAPGVFDLDDEGISVVLDPSAQPDDKIVLAAQGCPTQAIAVYRDGEKLV
jgi:ferredoxin